jgi:hypothetical protein
MLWAGRAGWHGWLTRVRRVLRNPGFTFLRLNSDVENVGRAASVWACLRVIRWLDGETYIYIYIYIERERESKRGDDLEETNLRLRHGVCLSIAYIARAVLIFILWIETQVGEVIDAVNCLLSMLDHRKQTSVSSCVVCLSLCSS